MPTSTSRYEQTQDFILAKLRNELPENLSYHGFHHVLDVVQAAEMLGLKENVSTEDLELLKVAALFHDSGFMVNSVHHEQIGCDIVKRALPSLGYSTPEIEKICGMILATKFPQKPKNHLEEILCDADLDYLGRDDFFSIGDTLFEELKASGTLETEKDWYQLQVDFLLAHKYFTKSAFALRNAQKEDHLKEVRRILASI